MPDQPNKELLQQYFKQAIEGKLRHSVVSLCNDECKPKEVFSGTLFTMNNRLFVITCAHAIPASKKVWVIRESGSFKSEGYPAIIAVHTYERRWPDIALLELDPQVLSTYLHGYRPISPDDLGSLDYANRTHSVVTLVGNTSEETLYRKIGKGDLIKTSIVFLNHKVELPDGWPEPLELDKQNDPTVDVYLKSVKRGEPAGDDVPDYYEKPHGLSGGGIWALNHKIDELWSPSMFQLVGVQASWNHKAGYLRGVRIEQLRELLPKQ